MGINWKSNNVWHLNVIHCLFTNLLMMQKEDKRKCPLSKPQSNIHNHILKNDLSFWNGVILTNHDSIHVSNLNVQKEKYAFALKKINYFNLTSIFNYQKLSSINRNKLHSNWFFIIVHHRKIVPDIHWSLENTLHIVITK